MPIINIQMWQGRDKETKKKLIDNVTKATCEAIKCPPEAVQIVIEDIPKENWGINGKQAE
ncbi:4-oxalocrotonate tautomerase [candidate division WOR-1 bacterium RIFOXYA2_FULL_37_7]|uniref:Tautomerase n=1 Tax=candidate division WOR-1 bacterium RIFOXYB2_FULL_37_13 TaxID=1802579 RepID=A0A1F4SVE2_UNCSA|nr:MAG: 4-oxalocrotonate tautomerase [candidate division WOR-1 bacterium RIFOXYA2_FULL_37_7]OGC24408.1 MAG: 4-oxalocrotonate tautomerase [candidate division WOR-1 bacterium RIFOXYB2_FULL_37_13]